MKKIMYTDNEKKIAFAWWANIDLDTKWLLVKAFNVKTNKTSWLTRPCNIFYIAYKLNIYKLPT